MPTTIPINKGNYAMETEAREELFECYRSEGWESEYAIYRRNWSDFPHRQFVSDYPLLVDLELATLCNLRCPMCYTITNEFREKVPAGLMNFELFTRIIDEIGGHVPALRLSLRGEPTLHPRFIDCIAYAKQRGIQEISLLTNGSTLTPDFFCKMMDAGVDWITLSIDGLGEVYEGIRQPLRFDDTYLKIQQIKMIKEQRGVHRPVIKIQSVWPAIKADPEAFYNAFAPYVDQVAFNPLIDYLGNDSAIDYEEGFICCQHYQRLVVGADGKAMICSNDEEATIIIGDTAIESIYAIWHGAELTRIRSQQKQPNGFLQIPVCRRCYLPRKTENSEKATINGRTITIKNYKNRSQAIGS